MRVASSGAGVAGASTTDSTAVDVLSCVGKGLATGSISGSDSTPRTPVLFTSGTGDASVSCFR